jgi:hypothetical protein
MDKDGSGGSLGGDHRTAVPAAALRQGVTGALLRGVVVVRGSVSRQMPGPSAKCRFYLGVIPAKAGIHFDFCFRAQWIPAFAGMTPLEVSAQ